MIGIVGDDHVHVLDLDLQQEIEEVGEVEEIVAAEMVEVNQVLIWKDQDGIWADLNLSKKTFMYLVIQYRTEIHVQ